jgi:hypothetical protein
LVLGRRHLEWVLRTYIAHYNGRRPHRGLELRRRTHGLIRLHGRLRAHTFERATCWADLSMSRILLLEVGSRVCVPFRGGIVLS